jgi:hypothetical protein
VGNSNQRNNYAFTDHQAKTGTNYYRLKVLDFDGKYSFSKIAAVAIDENASQPNNQVLYPNPIPRGGNLYLSGIGSGNLRVSVINALGQVVFDRAVIHEGGTFTLSTSLAAGVYTVRVFTQTGIYSEKVVFE